jgi:hypothetical protein
MRKMIAALREWFSAGQVDPAELKKVLDGFWI